MKQFLKLALVLLIVLVLSIGSVQAQDATQEPSPSPEAEVTAVVEPPVVVVENPSENRLTWRELGLYAVVAVVVITLGIVAYRLTTMVGNSYPPGTSTSLERARERAQKYTQDSPYLWDDLAFYLADPLVQNAIKAVKDREKPITQSDGTAVG